MPVRDMQLEKEWKVRFEEYKKSGLSVNAWRKETGFNKLKNKKEEKEIFHV